MIKFLKAIGVALGSITVVMIVGYAVISLIHVYPNYVSRDPDRIASKASLRIPEYRVVDSSVQENPITAWVDVKYIIMTDEPMDAKFIKRLEDLVQKDDCWSHETGGQTYSFHMYKNSENGPRIDVAVDVMANRINLVYGWWNYSSSIPSLRH